MDEQTAFVASQYDTLHDGLERIEKPQKFLNYGYSTGARQAYEERQAELCRRVFDLAGIGAGDAVADVGFGSGEQDFLLARERPFARLYGFNISSRQVIYATNRALAEGLSDRLSFHHSPAEDMAVLPDHSIDKLVAIECAFYFDRARFYAEAARVLRPGGCLALADICFDDRAAFLLERFPSLQRVGTLSRNRALWERHLGTLRIESMRRNAMPGAQQTVWRCLSSISYGLTSSELRTWLSLGAYTQGVVLGLATGLLRYDLVLLTAQPSPAATPSAVSD